MTTRTLLMPPLSPEIAIRTGMVSTAVEPLVGELKVIVWPKLFWPPAKNRPNASRQNHPVVAKTGDLARADKEDFRRKGGFVSSLLAGACGVVKSVTRRARRRNE